VLLLGPVATNNSIKRQLGSLSNNPHSNAVNLFYFDTLFQFDKHVNAVVKSRFFQLFFQQSVAKVKHFLSSKDLEIGGILYTLVVYITLQIRFDMTFVF